MNKVGIFGGSFNPVHKGHTELARAAFKALKLNELLIIPTAQSPHKKSSDVSFEDRMEIPTVSVKTGVLKSEKVEYSDFEYFFETDDLFAVIYKENVLVIQKQDLVAKTIDKFREFISDKVECIKV